MTPGRSNQLTKQVGEYLVASELARRGLLVATFSGNVPDFDLIATDGRGLSLPVQVKTATAASWPFNLRRFVAITLDGRRQVLGDLSPLTTPDLIWVFVALGSRYGEDSFYILEERQVQDILVGNYRAHLAEHDGIRPRAPRSQSRYLKSPDLAKYQDNWQAITDRFRVENP
jgi:hypothetical protein